MQVRRQDICVARVLSESNESLIIEVAKTDAAEFHLSDDVQENRFLTLLFTHNTAADGEPPVMGIWKPWEESET